MLFLTPKLAAFAGAMAVSAAALGLEILVPVEPGGNGQGPVQTTILAPGSFIHPQPGEFLQEGRPAAAPRIPARIGEPLAIMTYQVSLDDYARCVADGACEPADARGTGDAPVTGVSYLDATAYAAWYSQATGENWRLPTDEEWAFAAGDRFTADVEPLEDDPSNPARGWLSSYQREVDMARKPDPKPRARGSFGINERGVADIAGNVWEWTSSCYVRTTLSPDDTIESAVENCGVHVVEGFHRTYMSNFVRDGKSGGCAVGLPPDNLGFRLVRKRPGLFGVTGIWRDSGRRSEPTDARPWGHSDRLGPGQSERRNVAAGRMLPNFATMWLRSVVSPRGLLQVT